jgi:hypothetical protein
MNSQLIFPIQQAKERLKKFKLDKFKLRQSRAGYDVEVSKHYNTALRQKKIDKNFPEEHQKPLLDNY